jgi:hypothetical protein
VEADAETKPPSDLLPETFGYLQPTHVIRGEPDGRARVFRRKTTATEDGFIEVANPSSSPSAPVPAMGFEYPLRLPGDPKLDAFSTNRSNAAKRFVDAPGSAEASLDNGQTGVTFFDPG